MIGGQSNKVVLNLEAGKMQVGNSRGKLIKWVSLIFVDNAGALLLLKTIWV